MSIWVSFVCTIMSYWDGSSTLIGDLVLHLIGGIARMSILGIRRLSDNSISNSIGRNQLPLSTVPFSQDFGRWGTPQDSRVDKSREPNMRDMAR